MEQRSRFSDPVTIGLALSTGFVLVVSLLVGPKACEVTRLSLNELGDFFAGISSTLAFIWIIVAVLLQRIELQAQRDELRQSREAFVRSADYQDAQRKIMEEELIGAKSERRRREVAERAAERASLETQLQTANQEHDALVVARSYLEELLASFDSDPSKGHRWPNARGLRHLQLLGRLQPPNVMFSEPISAAVQSFANNLYSFAHGVGQLVLQADQTVHRSPNASLVEADLEQIEPEITRRIQAARDLLEPLKDRVREQEALLVTRRAELLNLAKRPLGEGA